MQQLRELVLQLKADNERLHQERAASPGGSGGLLPRFHLVTPHLQVRLPLLRSGWLLCQEIVGARCSTVKLALG